MANNDKRLKTPKLNVRQRRTVATVRSGHVGLCGDTCSRGHLPSVPTRLSLRSDALPWVLSQGDTAGTHHPRSPDGDLEDPQPVAEAPGSGPVCPAFSESWAKEQELRAGRDSGSDPKPSIPGCGGSLGEARILQISVSFFLHPIGIISTQSKGPPGSGTW